MLRQERYERFAIVIKVNEVNTYALRKLRALFPP